MKAWLVTDTHFFHDKMIKLCGRPKHFEEVIMWNWNSMVEPDDLVIHLGDVSWTPDTCMDRLNGRKILVKGNHDGKSYNWYMQHGFAFACETFTLDYGGLDIIFSHRPLIFHEHDLNIHGHLHNCAKVESVCPHFLVALENTEYKPLTLDSVVQQVRDSLEVKKDM